MTEEPLGRGDPVIRRLQQAFAHEEPATELAAVLQRAGHYQAGGPPAATHVYAAYAPALFRFFLAAVGDRRQAEDLTATAFASAIDSLPRFRGPVEALGGWLFAIARHHLYDFRRRQARSRVEPRDDNLGDAAAAASALGVLEPESGTNTTFWGDQRTHPALERLSPREREILGLLAKGWSTRRIAEECFVSLHTVRTHVQNILVKLDIHSKLEAVAFEHGRTAHPQGLDPLALRHLEDIQVVEALQQVTADQREVLRLSMVAGLSAPEVATALGKTVGEVKALRHRGLAGLARILGLRSSEQPQEHLSVLDAHHLAGQEDY
jgi:RNA polymerase sigma factor (sigma-70 family)